MRKIESVSVCKHCFTVVEGRYMDKPCPTCQKPLSESVEATTLAEMAEAYENGETYNE